MELQLEEFKGHFVSISVKRTLGTRLDFGARDAQVVLDIYDVHPSNGVGNDILPRCEVINSFWQIFWLSTNLSL